MGVDNFGQLVTHRNAEDTPYLFVDKTLFIQQLINTGDIITVITRPRRFGKSLNLSMLEHFFAARVLGKPTASLFEHLLISHHPEVMRYQGQHPVLFLTLKNVRGESYQLFYQRMCQEMIELFKKHQLFFWEHMRNKEDQKAYREICEGSGQEAKYEKALLFLARLYYEATDKKVIILLDEYDTPLHDAYVYGYYEQCRSWMASLFGNTFKGNDYLEKAVITGILKVAQASLFSALNNVAIYSMLQDDQYGAYFGFTEQETTRLLTQAALPPKAQTLKEMYNGYQVGGHILYNPFSIVSFVSKAVLRPDKIEEALRPYWIHTGGTHLIADLLRNNLLDLSEDLTTLIQGGTITTLIDEEVRFNPLLKDNAIAFWSVMLLAGYLKVVAKQKAANCLLPDYKLTFPNQEIKDTFHRLGIEVGAQGRQYASELIKACNHLAQGNPTPLATYLRNYLAIVASSHDTKGRYKEQFFHGLLLGLAACLAPTHHIRSNRESGQGRYDIALIPKDAREVGIILEIKVAEKAKDLQAVAQQACQQIKAKAYYRELQSLGVQRICGVGIAFVGSHIEVAWKALAM